MKKAILALGLSILGLGLSILALVLLVLLWALPVQAQTIQAREIQFTGPLPAFVGLTTGTGAPEGVLARCVGSVYLRTDGSSGSTVYFKETGSCTNSGWVTGALGGGGGGSHNLLGPTHTDTSSAAALRGAVIVGNSTPAWARVLPSVSGQVLRYNGSDTLFSTDGTGLSLNAANLTTGTVPASAFPALTGDVTTSAGSLATSLTTGAVTSAKILDATIAFGDIGLNGCTAGQFAHINAGATAWECADPGATTAHTMLSTTHTDTNAATLVSGDVLYADGSGLLTRRAVGTNGQVLTVVAGFPQWQAPAGGITGPGSSTDNALARWDGTGGSTLQNSAVSLDDTGALVFPDGITQIFNPNGTTAGINVGAQAGDPSTPANGDLWYDSTANELTARINGANVALGAGGGGTVVRAVGITIDGGGTTITTGVKGFVSVPFTGTITRATLLSTDGSATACSIVIDVWKDSYANYPPVDADSITASAPPTLSSANKSDDSTLTGWSTSLTAGDILGFNVDSVTGCSRVLLTLRAQ
jgi:hypothetical protein